MATKKLTEKQLYKAKVEWFQENEYEEVEPVAFIVKFSSRLISRTRKYRA